MKFTGETKFFIGVIIVTILILGGAIALFSKPAKEVSPGVLLKADSWATGSATPKATLVEFGDFECPSCGAAEPVIEDLRVKYKDQLKIVFRNFPLDQHPNARPAAEAAEAAGAQGKYWEMHDLLFKNQASLSKDALNGFGLELKLDMDKFTKEVTAETYKDKIQNDLNDGMSLGVNSTPTFYLNGKKLNLFAFSDLDTEVKKVIAP